MKINKIFLLLVVFTMLGIAVYYSLSRSVYFVIRSDIAAGPFDVVIDVNGKQVYENTLKLQNQFDIEVHELPIGIGKIDVTIRSDSFKVEHRRQYFIWRDTYIQFYLMNGVTPLILVSDKVIIS